MERKGFCHTAFSISGLKRLKSFEQLRLLFLLFKQDITISILSSLYFSGGLVLYGIYNSMVSWNGEWYRGSYQGNNLDMITITWTNMINYTVYSTKFKQVRFLKFRLWKVEEEDKNFTNCCLNDDTNLNLGKCLIKKETFHFSHINIITKYFYHYLIIGMESSRTKEPQS